MDLNATSPPSRPPGGRTSQADVAYRRLRQAIVTWKVEPGTWLTESAMQEISGLGRTPTREATTRLVEDGLLVAVPRNGYNVTDISVAEAAALYDVFETLAPMTGRLAAGRVDATALSTIDKLASDGAFSAVDDLVALTEQVFLAVHAATGNPWLGRVGRVLFTHLQRLWVLTWADGTPAEIRAGFSEMVAALRLADPETGASAFLTFTLRTRVMTLRAVEHYVQRRTAEAARNPI